MLAYGSVWCDVKVHDLPVFFKLIYLEVVEEKEKFCWSSFFLLYDFAISPK
jgi:hypothetical protein